jgi:zinc protease
MLLHNIIENTLPNGLKIICLKKTGAPIVSIQLWYKVGSVYEEDGIRGISHVLEHMMFRGSQNVASEEHSRRINDVGGHCNAYTAEDVTVYINSVPKEFLEMVLSLEADRMDKLALKNDLFNTERNVIIEEYHTYMNNPVSKAFLEFRQEFFKNHPYSLSPLGKIEDLQSLTIQKCQEYYSKWYKPSNAVLVIVGDIEEENIFEKVNKYFGDKKSAKTAVVQLQSEAGLSEGSHRMKRKVEFDVPLLVMGYPAPSSGHR